MEAVRIYLECTYLPKKLFKNKGGKKTILESPWVIISLNSLCLFVFFCWEKKITSYLYNYVNKSDGRFYDQPGFEYAAVTLDPSLCSMLTDKTLLTSHLQDRRQTARETDAR